MLDQRRRNPCISSDVLSSTENVVRVVDWLSVYNRILFTYQNGVTEAEVRKNLCRLILIESACSIPALFLQGLTTVFIFVFQYIYLYFSTTHALPAYAASTWIHTPYLQIWCDFQRPSRSKLTHFSLIGVSSARWSDDAVEVVPKAMWR